MKTKNRTITELVTRSLFVEGGTLSHQEVENFINKYRFIRVTGEYGKEFLEHLDKNHFKNYVTVCWYENASKGYIRLYGVNTAQIEETDRKLYNQILKVWRHWRGLK